MTTGTDGEFQLLLRQPLDILGAVPYLLGYHPTDSIVVIGLDDVRLHMATRADLPVDDAGIRATADGLHDVLRGVDINTAVLVAYGPDERVRPMLVRLATTFRKLGVALAEVIRAEDGRYWSYMCPDVACCPPEGTPYDVRDSQVAAEATLAGLPTMPDRAAYEAQVQPITGAARTAMTRATERAFRRLNRMLAAATDEPDLVARLVRGGTDAINAGLRAQQAGQPLDDTTAAWLSVLLCWSEVWDLALTRLGNNRSALLQSRALWLDVLRRAEPDLAPGPGTLFALAAWHRGELVLARLALDRVLDVDPADAVARIIESAITQGRPPWAAGNDSTVDPRRGPRVKPRRARRPRRRSSSRRAETPPT